MKKKASKKKAKAAKAGSKKKAKKLTHRAPASAKRVEAPVDLEQIRLLHGGHASREDGVCALEAVAWLAGEPHTDHPKCASPVIAYFLRSWNDSMGDEDRQILKPVLPLLIGTATTPEDETTRAAMLTDWLAREAAPGMLRVAGLVPQAEALEALAPLRTTDDFRAAQPALNDARNKADAARAAARDAAGDAAWAAARDAAWAAAWAAARDAAGDAAWAAARDAAGDAARYAARDAARDAAWAAARDAAGDAAWAAAGAALKEKSGLSYDEIRAVARKAADERLDPTKRALQASAVKLVERLCAVGRVAA